jgi:hypothetical protein
MNNIIKKINFKYIYFKITQITLFIFLIASIFLSYDLLKYMDENSKASFFANLLIMFLLYKSLIYYTNIIKQKRKINLITITGAAIINSYWLFVIIILLI